MEVRAAALCVLDKCEKAGQYSNIALDSEIKKENFSSLDKALFTTLVYGVIERKLTLDFIINSLSARKSEKIDSSVRNILRMGLYQLIYLDKIPAHAAVNESVCLCKNKGTAAFVNAILRSYLREKENIRFPSEKDGLYEYLSVKYSVSQDICKILCDAGGKEEAEKYLSALSSPPKITLRVNTLKKSRAELLSDFQKAGIKACECKYSDFGISLLQSVPLADIDGFEAGEFFVQDEASQLCIKALAPIPNETILDSCACPGSKSFSSAIEMKNKGKLISADLHKNKLSLILSGAKKLGIDIIETKEQDGRIFVPEYAQSFDKVLCDVPCSGLGVLAKKPDIRYKDEKSLSALPEIQYAIISNCEKYLKVGGTLVYSTCTVNPRENEDVVLRFLAEHKNFDVCGFSFGEENERISSKSGMLTLMPHIHGTDGFFIAKLIKRT